ncbi:hypothetical protein ACFP3I_16900 [Chryseobacterium arachidis]
MKHNNSYLMKVFTEIIFIVKFTRAYHKVDFLTKQKHLQIVSA